MFTCKHCNECRETTEEFWRKNRKGVLSPVGICVDCHRKESKEGMRRTRERDPTQDKRASDKYKKKDPVKARFKNLKSRSGDLLQMTLEEFRALHTSDVCPICDTAFIEHHVTHKNLRSVDRIIPGGPYSFQNCWLICHRCNQAKSDWSLSRLKKLVHLLEEEISKRGL